MTPTSVFRKAILASVISSTLALTGCGGSDDDSSSENAPQTPTSNKAPTVSIGGEDQAKEQTEFKLSAEAADSDGSIASYEWTYQSDIDLTVSGADSAELTVTSANISEDKAVTFTLTVTDDDGATASVDKAIVIKRKVSSVTITGIVTDKPIVNANLTIFAGSASVNAFADETGRYTATFSVDESEADSLVQIRATGLGDQDNVEFVSQLNSMNKLVEQAGEDGELISDENFGVNITNVSTAEYALLTREGEAFSTDEELQQALLNVDAEEKIKLAALIKIVVDNDDYELPEGVESTLDLVDDAATAAQFETEVNARDPEIIKKTEEEIKNDDDLVSGNTGSLVGDYIIHNPQYVSTAAYHLKLSEDGKGTVAAVNQVDISSWTNTDGNVELVLAAPLIISQSEVAVRDEFGNIVTDDQNNIVFDTVVYKTSKLNLKVISANEVFRSIDFVTNAQRYVNGTLDETSEANTSIYSSNLLDKSKTLAVEKSDLVATWYLDIRESNYIGDDALRVQKLVFNEDGTITGAGENETVTWSVENNVLTINYTDADYKGSSHFWITKSLAAGYQFVVLDNGRIKEDGSVDINDVHAKSEWGWLFKQDASLAMEEKDVIGRWTGFIGFDQDLYDMNVDEDLNVSIGLNPSSWAGRFEDGVFYRERYEQDGNYVSFCDISLDNCERGLMTHEFVAVADDKYFIRRTYEWNGAVQGDILAIYEYSPETEYTEFTAGLLQSGTTFFTYDTEGNLVEGSFTYSTDYAGDEERFVSELSIGEQTFTFSLVDGKLVYNTANGNYVVELIELTDTGIAVCTYPEGESCTDANKSTWSFELPHLGEFFINNPDFFSSTVYQINLEPEIGTIKTRDSSDEIQFDWSFQDGKIFLNINHALWVAYTGDSPQARVERYLESITLDISKDGHVAVFESQRQETENAPTEYFNFEYESKKLVDSDFIELSAEDIVGSWIIGAGASFRAAEGRYTFNENGTGSAVLNPFDGMERTTNFNWQVLGSELILNHEDGTTEDVLKITKDLRVDGHQFILQRESESIDQDNMVFLSSRVVSGIMLKNEADIQYTAEDIKGRWLYRSGEDITDAWASMEVYDDLTVHFGLNTSPMQGSFENNKFKRKRYYNPQTSEMVAPCEVENDTCALLTEFEYNLIAQDDNRSYFQRVANSYLDSTLSSSSFNLLVKDKQDSIAIDHLEEFNLSYLVLEDRSDESNPILWRVEELNTDSGEWVSALKVGDAEPLPYTFADGKMTMRKLDGQVYNIELVPGSNDKDSVTVCEYLNTQTCETGTQIKLHYPTLY
ncbi:hypothetical protein CWB72_06255 [Pseudoalteromonas phenolica]|uniref:PKD domain-containing protein n=1 Tax=Pseudoalteromonas phenolica TaxID=161398 RepID=UPI00110C056F|nr:hypothetical protein [Pseudoalteromonas phenolica]TMN91701.1 hypothetical protein CWB72_06255 [Pseudoalteromonas phenolica]